MDNSKFKFSEELREAAESFLITEFEVPLDKVQEEDYGMYEYRNNLVRTAVEILGGDSKEDLDDVEIEE